MLDIVVRRLGFRYDGGFSLADLELTAARGTHTAVVGPSGCGASTLLRLLAGTMRPASGDILLGQRRVNDLGPRQRPVLLATAVPDVPSRWSVEHALVAAVRTRSLDRIDRHRELSVAAGRWGIEALLGRRMATLSSTERTRVQIARIDLFRPAVLLADRVLEGAGASAARPLADEFYRALRVHGTTVVSAPASIGELAMTEQVVVLDGGKLVQSGPASEVYRHPASEAAARATGVADAIPVTVNGTTVESVIGSWEVPAPSFQGSVVALVRPHDFEIAPAGEESDLIFGIEEGGFADGRWLVSGILSGGLTLHVELPEAARVHKGRLLALRYDPARFTLLPRAATPLQTTVPTDVVPPMSETR